MTERHAQTKRRTHGYKDTYKHKDGQIDAYPKHKGGQIDTYPKHKGGQIDTYRHKDGHMDGRTPANTNKDTWTDRHVQTQRLAYGYKDTYTHKDGQIDAYRHNDGHMD